jgi:hypothetical protein
MVVAVLMIAISIAAGQALAKKPDHWTGPCPEATDCDCIVYLYAPVICHGDCVYANKCLAKCAGATGCQPYYF